MVRWVWTPRNFISLPWGMVTSSTPWSSMTAAKRSAFAADACESTVAGGPARQAAIAFRSQAGGAILGAKTPRCSRTKSPLFTLCRNQSSRQPDGSCLSGGEDTELTPAGLGQKAELG